MEAYLMMLTAMFIPMSINYIFAISTAFLSLFIIYFIDVVFLKTIDTIEELKNGNIAVAIVITGVIYSISHLIGYMVG